MRLTPDFTNKPAYLVKKKQIIMCLINYFISIVANNVTYAAAYTITYIKVMSPQPLKHIVHKIHIAIANPASSVINDDEISLPLPMLLRSSTVGSNCSTCDNYGTHIVQFDRRGLFFYCTECAETHNFMDGHFRFNGVIHTIYKQYD